MFFAVISVWHNIPRCLNVPTVNLGDMHLQVFRKTLKPQCSSQVSGSKLILCLMVAGKFLSSAIVASIAT